VLTLVGSKGKGTAAAYASAYLSAAGRRVVTITSPAHRSNRERIRVDGRAVANVEMERLAGRIAAGIDRLPERTPGHGYLAPSGLFIVAGMLHALATGADAVVLEAGRGGGSDEACLFTPSVAAITPIFEEHLGELGDSVAAIARDKASVIGPQTRAVLAAAQRAEVDPVLRATVAQITGGRVTVETVAPGVGGIPADLLPGGLGTANAELGCAAAQRLLDVTLSGRPPAARLRTALSSIVLPGRLSWHRVPGTATGLLLDQAVTGAGTAAALATARRRWGGIDHALVSLSDDKDLNGVMAELKGTPVTFVRLNRSHLGFTRNILPGWAHIEEDQLSLEMIAGLGGRVLAVGTFSFIALMLELLNAPTERLFTAPS
jgi:dihydrofolate synthase/folylpolyglutamate synthase